MSSDRSWGPQSGSAHRFRGLRGKARFGLLAVPLLGLGIARVATSADAAPAAKPVPTIVQVSGAATSPAIAPGFIGLSLEYGAVPAYAGTNPAAINPVFARLIANLAAPGSLILRIGGDSADRTWWPVKGMVRPAGVKYVLGPRWAAVARALDAATGARMILGINLEAGSTAVASAEARALITGIGLSRVSALEIGNEPEFFTFPWYRRVGGVGVPGRPPSYGFSAYEREFRRFAHALPPLPLAGPATGTLDWLNRESEFLGQEPTVDQVTLHRYPLNRCVTNPRLPAHPTLAHLLSRYASRGVLDGIGTDIAIAHAHDATFRIDELNSVTCQGRWGVSNTFASALWMTDILFGMARVGVDAVNVHIWPGARPNELFTFQQRGGIWTGSVRPAYYGLLLFNAAAPPGSHLVHTVTTGPGLRSWATIGADGRIRITLINTSLAHARVVRVVPPGPSKYAQFVRLRAPSATATGGVTLAGQRFGAATATGTLIGTPRIFSRRPFQGAYTLTVSPASAVLLTVTPA